MSGLAKSVFELYQVDLTGAWTNEARATLMEACEDLFGAWAVRQENIRWLRGMPIIAEPIRQLGLTCAQWIKFNPAVLSKWTVVHEFGHAWDFASGLRNSSRMQHFTHSWGPLPLLHQWRPADERFWYHPGSLPPPCGKDRNFNRLEDFAEAVAAYVYPEEAKKRADERGMGYELYGYESFYATPRGRFIHELIHTGR
ncbi:MAG: hypothetical protein VB013_04795 [Anaerolineaceae bacterium]|nr:hypothetical protein [Anaerolineaceae bacterium]